ncbi:DUF2141 domain-containing protein [Aquimarina pacifica]|uniref:DUF2141 domain-containing protein n=1 Tax=Aquimarina pacifica TaxID=1296415 RepID=UPI00046E8231|nr:DUF2141 domain-containing protein [Aquimarina pacifica]
MKTLALFIALYISNFCLQAQETQDNITITVTVPNVTSSEGAVLFALYNEETFLKRTPLQEKKSTITDGVATITFTKVSKGTLAITCFHDVNGNEQMDFEPNGMPKENYGVSNNNMTYGPPVWSDAKFEVNSEDIDVEIRM